MAISPVVGVMLMLVVTIIIAAVVTGFPGGLRFRTEDSADLGMDVKIVNTGTWLGSGFFGTVNGVSAPYRQATMRLVTTWATNYRSNGTPLTGGGIQVCPA